MHLKTKRFKRTTAFTLGKPDAPIVVAVAETLSLGKGGLVRATVNGGFITDGPVLTASTPSGTAINFANAVNAYTGGEIDFTAEVDGEYIYLFTEASYEQPFEIDFLDDDPSFEHNEYFDYVPLKRIGIRPHGGSFTEIPLHETVTLSDLHIYGSSRLGIKTPDLPITKRQVGYTYTSNYGNSLYLTILDSRDIALDNPAIGPFFEHEKGLKQYELSNHLGNVLVVFEDKKVSHEGSTGVVGHYTASLLRISDYYPFGAPMPGRVYNGPDYRQGYQGSEKDNEITNVDGAHYSTFFRELDTRLCRWWSPDPIFQPWQTSYSSMDNNPILYNDVRGDWKTKANEDGTITYTAEKNDNFYSFMEQYSLDRKTVVDLFKNHGLDSYLPQKFDDGIEFAPNAGASEDLGIKSDAIAITTNNLYQLDYSVASEQDKINQLFFAVERSDPAKGFLFEDYFQKYENYRNPTGGLITGGWSGKEELNGTLGDNGEHKVSISLFIPQKVSIGDGIPYTRFSNRPSSGRSGSYYDPSTKRYIFVVPTHSEASYRTTAFITRVFSKNAQLYLKDRYNWDYSNEVK